MMILAYVVLAAVVLVGTIAAVLFKNLLFEMSGAEYTPRCSRVYTG